MTLLIMLSGSIDFRLSTGDQIYKHQRAYNNAFEIEFTQYNWEQFNYLQGLLQIPLWTNS